MAMLSSGTGHKTLNEEYCMDRAGVRDAIVSKTSVRRTLPCFINELIGGEGRRFDDIASTKAMAIVSLAI